MSQSPTLAVVRRPRDLAMAKPGPKPEPVPPPDDDEAAVDVAALDRRPPMPAGVGHYPPKLPPRSAPRQRETTVYSACKMPLWMDQAVKATAREHNMSASEVIRSFVDACLRRPFALEEPAS